MASEAQLVFETEVPIPFKCATGATIEKGAICMLTTPMTAALATGDADLVAGVAAEEKINGDGKTSIAIYRRGIFLMLAGQAGITVGLAVGTYASTGATNEIGVCAAGHDNQLGNALETFGDTTWGLVELNPIVRDEA